MILIAADTSALISLEIDHLIEKTSEIIQFMIPEIVKEELKGMALFDDVHGRSAKSILKLIERRLIIVECINPEKEYNKNIDIGESATLTLAIKHNCDYMITDDVRALPYLKLKSNIKVLTSAFVVWLLYDLGEISREDAIRSLKKIASERDWYGGVLEALLPLYFSELK